VLAHVDPTKDVVRYRSLGGGHEGWNPLRSVKQLTSRSERLPKLMALKQAQSQSYTTLPYGGKCCCFKTKNTTRAGTTACRGATGPCTEARGAVRGGAVLCADLGCSSSYSIGPRDCKSLVEDWSGGGFHANSRWTWVSQSQATRKSLVMCG